MAVAGTRDQRAEKCMERHQSARDITLLDGDHNQQAK